MSEANPIKLSLSIFTNFSESLSFSPPFSKSPRNFEQPLVGLGIVAAMSDATEPIDAKIAVSPRSEPIPIVSAKSGSVFRGPASEDDDEMEVSESYTCVISHVGDEAVRKREYFDGDDGMRGNYWGWSEVFFASPPAVMYGEGFLSCCYLCRKKLHGLDVFIYGGDKAFCSAECRSQQMLSDELKEKCGSEAHKSAFDYSAFDYSASPCSAPRLFSAGVAAA